MKIDPRPGKRLCQIREHRDISQGRLARALGVTVGTIQHYEQGRTRITTERLEELARALQCETTDLLMPPDSPLPRYRRPRYRPFQERASSQWFRQGLRQGLMWIPMARIVNEED